MAGVDVIYYGVVFFKLNQIMLIKNKCITSKRHEKSNLLSLFIEFTIVFIVLFFALSYIEWIVKTDKDFKESVGEPVYEGSYMDYLGDYFPEHGRL